VNAFIANTDYNWYQLLSTLPNLDEVNFWRPLGGTNFRALSIGEPLFFKLKKNFGNAIVGFGLFVAFKSLNVLEAWETFGKGNGANSFDEISERIFGYLRHFNRKDSLKLTHKIGCILLTSPIFFPRDLWIKGPTDWNSNIVSGKTYNTKAGEGKRIWQECLERISAVSLNQTAAYNFEAIKEAPKRYGTERLIKPRLGQGSFRYVVENAYRQCAVTREHSLPALDAAHIYPYAIGGPHVVDNGLLLRADIHKLFDRGYVTITPDFTFRVSKNLQEEFQNGKIYYKMHNSKIWLPKDENQRPNIKYLEYHNNEVFQS
jgi:putative restriction endonuclease